MIKIYYTIFEKEFKDSTFQRYLNILPSRLKTDVMKYSKWNDKYSSLFGKLLLKKGLKEMAITNGLNDLKFTEYGRPYLDSQVDFNISHSMGCVVCAFTDNGRVGIDVEKIEPIDFDVFKSCFTSNEWNEIEKNKNDGATFFHYWTKKEAVIKADGRGLSIPLGNFEAVEDFVCLSQNNWIINQLEISDLYKVHLVSSKNQNFELIKVDFYSHEGLTQKVKMKEVF
ncbi:4'-phosphopantetheinyl transferase superfamily protein [Flavobacterium jejuense]|uniref:4'-phosphopantetheinyl transferase superfamily protein n=1 Tax=Flavobacterium jejuense TaxID=1544455 RepID=A0ABX0IUZ7_9FLAO|nr:4'-phosphopantetheinyl transferase superfamily protein [Flavobacterium jejuense]NHN25901.1 4'-phosphopantetheinyl transferase superfamily protein [Flavobacterium jejuense]